MTFLPAAADSMIASSAAIVAGSRLTLLTTLNYGPFFIKVMRA